jgi:antitoxin (DNA-binding transcriptional repressor) of toxin-antitoxin stability system
MIRVISFVRFVNHILDRDAKYGANRCMTRLTSRMLHEKTDQILDRVCQGERFRITRKGKADVFLVSASELPEPEWSEIMAAVWKAQEKTGRKRPNPVLNERKRRAYSVIKVGIAHRVRQGKRGK